jgi:two-component system CheB/CheR fusion protein
VTAKEPESEAAPAALAPTAAPAKTPALIVGVGASAGGLEAFTELLENVPAGSGLTFLFVLHLDPERPSTLIDILSKSTPLKVEQAQQDLTLEPEHVYIIPRSADMAVHGNQLVLVPRPRQRKPHMPADLLFRSLAEEHGSHAVGVVLSGGGTDGALGLRAIKAEGGITFVQDEQSARQPSMPRSAFLEGAADHVLPPAEIARRLAQIARHSYAAEAAVPAAAADTDLGQIVNLLRSQTAVDFSHYKQTTVARRIRRRMALRGLEAVADYQRLLHNDASEVQNLYQDLLIRVTRFFRDEGVFAALKAQVFPTLVKDRSANAPIRIWVAGCSTGEEVYSQTIALVEFLSDQHIDLPVKVLATDVNEEALERARTGVFVDNIEQDVSPERLRRFFTRLDSHYQIGKTIRDLCIFSRHNLAADPPFSRLDLVSCRNVLIYLDGSLHKRILPAFHHALNPEGFLLLGTSESVGSFASLFDVVDAPHRIYRKNNSVSQGRLDLGTFPEKSGRALRTLAGGPSWSALDVQKEADRIVLSRYAPAGVVVDDNMTVLQFRGRTGPYLEPAPGTASLDLLKMLREGLLGDVRAAIHHAKVENVPVRKEGIPLREDGRIRLVNAEVIPFKVPPSGACCLVVLFQEAAAPSAAGGPPAPPSSAPSSEQAAEQQIAQLQQELAATREYLQALIEEHEAASEELKSASEELLSSNEELQSTNEELETAKEETQSTNEELATVNEELHHRNLQLGQLNNDLVNLLGAVNIAIVLVGRDLRIRRFTPKAETVFNLIPTDVGRPISDINPNLDVSDLAARITKVIDTLTPVDGECQDHAGHWYSLRIRPYVTLENNIDGATVALLDVDAIKRGQKAK